MNGPLFLIFFLQVLESCVKNCGSLVHEEIATRPFMEELRDLLKHSSDDNTKQKILEMLQTWGMAFRNSPRYRIVTVSHHIYRYLHNHMQCIENTMYVIHYWNKAIDYLLLFIISKTIIIDYY